MATEEDVPEGPWYAGAIGRIPDDDSLVYREDAVWGAKFYAGTPAEAELAARFLNDLEARLARAEKKRARDAREEVIDG
jgi:hypothetical protein